MARRLRFGLYYDFRNPAQWRQDWTGLYAGILAQIERAEALGWDDVWLSEHHFVDDGYTPSCLPLLAAIAARTSTLRVGTAVLLLPMHDPVRVAEDVASVDVLSGGRVDLGVGLGYRDAEFAGFGRERRTRAPRFEEGLQILRALFAGERVDFDGAYHQVRGAELHPRPVQQPPRVLVGGFAEPAARRAARLGDGLIVNGGLGMAAVVDAYRDELDKLGEDPAAHEVISGEQWMIVSRDPERRASEARRHISYVFGRYASWMTGAGDDADPPQLDDEALRARGVRFVSPQQAADHIGKVVEAQDLSRWYGWTLPAGLPPGWADEHIELMANEVMPALR